LDVLCNGEDEHCLKEFCVDKSCSYLTSPSINRPQEPIKQYGPISNVIIYAGARIDGIEVFYDDQPGALIGRKGGSQQEALELRPGEFVTGLGPTIMAIAEAFLLSSCKSRRRRGTS